MECHRDDYGTGRSLLQGKAEGTETVQHREEKAQRYKYLKRMCKEDGARLSLVSHHVGDQT